MKARNKAKPRGKNSKRKNSPKPKDIAPASPNPSLDNRVVSMDNIWHAIRFPSASNSSMIYKMFINGEWIESSNKQTFEVRNSYDNSVVGRVQKATKEDALRTVEAAFNAKSSMAKMDAIQRIELLDKIKDLVSEHREELIDMLIREAGKPRVYAEGEVKATIERLHYACEETKIMYGEYIPGDLISGTSQKFALVSGSL